MAPRKFVIKCGNFAVLVDLHVLPLRDPQDASWFTPDNTEEVAELVRDAVDQRVKAYADSLRNKKHQKQRKELTPASTFYLKGKNFHLAANFLKRHSNLRCISKHLYGDLRVFPERYVVCVSCPEDAPAQRGNLSLAATELGEQSRSEYFSRVGETQEPLNSPAKTKKTVLQKIAKQSRVQQELDSRSIRGRETHQSVRPKDTRRDVRAEDSELRQKHTVSSSGEKVLPEADLNAVTEEVGQTELSAPDSIHPNGAIQETHQTNNKRCKPVEAGEDPNPQRAKRTCLGRPLATALSHSAKCSTQAFRQDLPVLPIPQAEASAESKAFPVAECKKTTLEVELLTPGKRAQRLPLTSNNTAQTNQNRLATSLRGLSVKPASSGASISSRSTLVEEGSENVPRTSRLRRLKRS
ncbi:protein SLX4IP [Betta splendens]|uniref:Protein SLX4IP n=1 Tax=Betta splendens TaxID=158456 RepID=A0A6P7KKP2_BETSP|nr:protein SLX4IP [Betta splendens]XP_028983137.1 protein SLX4IP [Betta splendens]XP_028983138.1 protein SLX4IP [Betta splendens]